MNPFTLPGPEFLRFYFLFGVAVIALGRVLRSMLDKEPLSRLPTRFVAGQYPKESEAYHIAFLRGGGKEVARAVLAQAAIKNLITVVKGKLQRKDKPKQTLEPIEGEVLDAVSLSKRGHDVLTTVHRGYHRVLSKIEDELVREGLLRTSAERGPFLTLMLGVIGVLLGVGAIKIAIALSAGRSNVEYLIVLMIMFTIVTAWALRPARVTPPARDYLDWVKFAHRGLINLVNQGREATAGEVALCVAIFGLEPLHTSRAMELKKALRPAVAEDVDTGGFSSSCGSSGGGGSSCGGGCGGGGCGGCGSD